jgi:hypothetical protein
LENIFFPLCWVKFLSIYCIVEKIARQSCLLNASGRKGYSWDLADKGKIFGLESRSKIMATSTNTGDIAYCSLVIYFMIEYDN